MCRDKIVKEFYVKRIVVDMLLSGHLQLAYQNFSAVFQNCHHKLNISQLKRHFRDKI